MEIVIIGIIALFVLEYNKRISTNRFIKDNLTHFRVLKEKDYDFYVKARYGETADPEILFSSRVRLSLITLVVMFLLLLGNLTFINLILIVVVAYFVFKSQYNSLKSYYKKHLHQINLQLPFFLKMMEILAQHYTIPVALSRTVDTAPEIFRPGLREM